MQIISYVSLDYIILRETKVQNYLQISKKAFFYLFLQQSCRKVTLACVWQEDNDVLACKLRTLSYYTGGVSCCTRGNSDEEAVFLSQSTSCGKRILVAHRQYLVDERTVEVLWLETCTYALNLVRTRRLTGEDCTRGWLNSNNIDIGIVSLESLGCA